MVDFNRKKTFLQQGSELYNDMIALTDSDTVKRYLAFRIIVNAMSFEDINAGNRRFSTMRRIRNTLLAHKQEPNFFKGFHAVDHITKISVGKLLRLMVSMRGFDPRIVPMERKDVRVGKRFQSLVRDVLTLYVEDELNEFRLTNNFLAYTGDHVHEISDSNLAGVFYRYNSSKALFSLAEYIYNNTHQQQKFRTSARHAKLDMILHAQNMADCVFRDTRNRHSIDGLLEVCEYEGVGDLMPLQNLQLDASYQRVYCCARTVRNKLIGHMDTSNRLDDLLEELDQLPTDDVRKLVILVDNAVYIATRPHPALWVRYHSGNAKLNNGSIIHIPGFKPKPYEDN